MNKPKRKVAMLDRDGVLNENRGYVGFKKDFKWIKGAKETIKKLKQLKFLRSSNYKSVWSCKKIL